MSTKPENQFIHSVHHHLPPELYKEKMSNMNRGGTADVWYSGNNADLWIEYKFLPTVPKRRPFIQPDLSALQLHWLFGRYKEGRNVAVILGCPDGGVIFTDVSWKQSITLDEFHQKLRVRRKLAEWIVSQTMR